MITRAMIWNNNIGSRQDLRILSEKEDYTKMFVQQKNKKKLNVG